MKKKIAYTDEELNGVVVEDFLPSPDQLVFKESSEKVTIALSKRSLAYFRELGTKTNIPYQRMIRSVLDEYVQKAGENSKS